MKIFLALLFSFAYATELLELKGGTIQETPRSEFDQSTPDTFCFILSFLNAEDVLSLRILNHRIYHMVRNYWPKMRLSTIIEGSRLGYPVRFSHNLEIRADSLEVQTFPYNRDQLSCLREFLFNCKDIHNLQAVIDILPKNSLTSLKLQILRWGTCPLISEINFPKLTHLELSRGVTLNHTTFSFLPNSMKVLKVIDIRMDDSTSISLATALQNMKELEVLSISFCDLSKDSLSAILENLPVSLKSLNISHNIFSDSGNNLSKPGLERLKEMKSLQKIDFSGGNVKYACEIILNLPNCITDIVCCLIEETLNAFQQRKNEFTNVTKISPFWIAPVQLYPVVQGIFPNLDQDIVKALGG